MIRKTNKTKPRLTTYFGGAALVLLVALSIFPRLNNHKSLGDPSSNSNSSSSEDSSLSGLPAIGDSSVSDSSDSSSSEPEDRPTTETYEVISVVDGDTIKINYQGQTTSVRLIGVNTPETIDPRKDVECYGEEASNYLKDLLTGKTVTIAADASQADRDKYNRLLRYVYLDGQDVNYQIIANGYGYEYTYNVPYEKQASYKAAQSAAEAAGKGLWAAGICEKTAPQYPASSSGASSSNASNSNTSSSHTSNSSASNAGSHTSSNGNSNISSTTAGNSNCNIKGNINSKGEKIYHVPGGAYYHKTQIDASRGERWFCSEAEAQAAGWRRSKR